MRGWIVFIVAILGCGSLALPEYTPHTAETKPAPIEVPYPPPPARVEALPPQPPGKSVWIDGEWSWLAPRWLWIRGRWVIAPPYAKYSPWAINRASDGAIFYWPGTWRNAKGAEIPAPAPLALATDIPGALVDSEGAPVKSRKILEPPGADGGTSDLIAPDASPEASP